LKLEHIFKYHGSIARSIIIFKLILKFKNIVKVRHYFPPYDQSFLWRGLVRNIPSNLPVQ